MPPFSVDRILAETGSETLKRRTPLLWPRWNITVKRKKRRLCPPAGLGKNRGNKTRPDVPTGGGGGIRSNDYLFHPCMTPSLESGGDGSPLPSFNALFSTWITWCGCCLLGRGLFEVMTSPRSRFFAKFIEGRRVGIG